MFADFLKRLTGPDPSPLPDSDARLALAALMVRIARSDGDYAPQEIHQIDKILHARYALDAEAVLALRREAEVLETEAPDTVRFTRAIKDAVPYEDRESVVEALWTVVLADGERDYHEDAQLRLLASLLGVSDRSSSFARQRAEKKRG
jgi:uncharacterized tellurite resistance protein B-like protein